MPKAHTKWIPITKRHCIPSASISLFLGRLNIRLPHAFHHPRHPGKILAERNLSPDSPERTGAFHPKPKIEYAQRNVTPPASVDDQMEATHRSSLRSLLPPLLLNPFCPPSSESPVPLGSRAFCTHFLLSPSVYFLCLSRNT
jgi:hypothetical protein